MQTPFKRSQAALRASTFLLSLLTCSACLTGKSGQQAPSVDTAPSLAADSLVKFQGITCYVPPAFEGLPPQERRLARSRAITTASRRWQGEVDSSFQLPAWLAERLENTVMSQAERIEQLTQAELPICQQFAEGKISLDEYQSWLRTYLEKLEQDDCSHPPFELITQYLEVNKRWQIETPLCRGEVVLLRASAGQYTVEAREPEEESRWITADGDRDQPTRDPAYPCHTEGCFKGQVLARFVDRAGQETILPMGRQLFFKVPAHGRLSFGVNDDLLVDNRFRTQEQITDYLMVEIFPAEQQE